MRVSRCLLTGIGLAFAGLTFAQAPAVGGRPTAAAPEPKTITRIEPPSAIVVSAETAPQPVGFESDLYCFGYLGELNEKFPIEVTGAENVGTQTDFITGDLLYVNGGYDKGIRVGDPYWVITPEQQVIHPLTGASMGRLYQYRGRAVVQSVAPRTAMIRVLNACTDIPIGSSLKKFEPIPIPLARKTPLAQPGDPPSGKVKGHIVFTRDGLVAIGTDATLIIDLGIADGIQPGDFLTIFRYSVGSDVSIRPVGSYWVNVPPPPGIATPRTYLGELAVMVAGDRWAIARVTDASRLIDVGDEVELK
jgi:hypothetical protein